MHHAWKRDKDACEDIPGFWKSATLDVSSEHGYVLTPGRAVGVEEVGIPFANNMATLPREFTDQIAESAELEKAIPKKMKAIGFELPKTTVK